VLYRRQASVAGDVHSIHEGEPPPQVIGSTPLVRRSSRQMQEHHDVNPAALLVRLCQGQAASDFTREKKSP